MAVTQNEYTGNGSTTTYSFTFPYLQTTDVKVKLDGVTQATTTYTFPTATTVQMNSAPGNNVKVLIYRDTGNDNKKATFYPGSAIKAEDLNDDFDQILYTAQEIDNYAMTTLGDDTMIGNLQMGENQLVFEGATADAFETSIGVVDPTADRTINFPNVSGTVITTGDTGTVNSTILAANSVDSSELVDGSVDLSHMSANSVDSDQYVDGSIDHVHLSTDLIDGDNIQDDVINSEHIAAGAVDLEHMSANSVDSDQYIDGSIDRVHLEADIIDGTKLADNAVNSEHITAGSVDLAHMSANSIDSDQYVDGSIDRVHLSADIIDATKIEDNAVTTDHIADAELTTLAGMQSATASILASGTALTATNAEINTVCDGKTVQTTISDTDASYPTSGAVVDYVAAQIAPLGGLEVIANEDSFPTQPSSGVVISIADAGGIVVNGSGVSTTARTSGNGSDNVTINGFPSSLYSTTLAANMGLMVSSTGSSNTYTYHKLLGKEDDIKQLSDDINDFAARYRVASSAPSSSLDNGDLWYDTSNAKMMVYNATASAWEEVTSTGDFYINTISSYSGTGGNSATFNGSAYRFVLSNPPQAAQQLIVSVNGVLQKPNSGTGQPSEGFALNGSSIVFSAAPATSSPYFIITVGSTVAIGTPSDNTVSTAKIQNGAVTTDKLGADQVTGAKIADDAVGAEHIEVLDANLQLADNAKIQIGTGNDLEIFHDGTNSWIKDVGTNRLIIDTDGQGIDLTKSGASEYLLRTAIDGAVELYHDGTKKFQTYSTGIQCLQDVWFDNDTTAGRDLFWDSSEGLLRFYDSAKATFGSGDDLQIYHDGNHSLISDAGTGDLKILTSKFKVINNPASADELMIQATENGAVELYYNGGKRLATQDGGVDIWGCDDCACEITMNADLGTHDDDKWRMRAEASSSLWQLQNYKDNAWENNIQCQGGEGGVFLNYNNTQRFWTTSTGAQVSGKGVISGDLGGNYILEVVNDGSSWNRYGVIVKCGQDNPDTTNYAITITDGNGDAQGYITFNAGTVTYGAFTAHHPCTVPDADNPSDNSNAYPYGTLLETISIEYTQKDGADTERGIRYKVQKTQSANSRKVLGAYGSSMNGGPDGKTNEHQVLILGDGHILVNNAGGNIEVGDGICSSATAGIGQKATANPSMIIGIAQEAITFTGSETKLVAVQYGLQQFIPWT